MLKFQLLIKLQQTSCPKTTKQLVAPLSYTCQFRKFSSVEKKPDLNYDGSNLPTSIKVVICGGGVMGAAVAYHLAELGWGQNTVLIEQGR